VILVLRIIHIVAGVFWVGSAMFAALLLAPALRGAGPASGQVMNQLVKVQKMPIAMMISSLLTIAAGIWLMMIDSAGSAGVWMKSSTGRTFGLGAVLAILAFVLGMTVNSPAAKRLGALGAAAAARGGPPTAEEAAQMQRLQGRMSVASQIVTLLLVLATGAMAIARYMT
jgi:hypothetical protein